MFVDIDTKSFNLIREIFSRNILSYRDYLLPLIDDDKLSSVNYFLFKFNPDPFQIKNILNHLSEDDYYIVVLEEYINKTIINQI